MYNKIKVSRNSIVVLSGLPASGKSTFIKNNINEGVISKEMVLSMDEIRKKISGVSFVFQNGKLKKSVNQEKNLLVFQVLMKELEGRASEKMFSILDITSLTDKSRSSFFKLADKYGLDFKVLIFDRLPLEELIERDKEREYPADEDVILRLSKEFQEDSKYPYEIVNKPFETLLQIEKPTMNIKDNKLDVVGDLHGQLKLFKELMSKLGWDIKNNILEHQDKDRKILFLGDWVDRGEDSVTLHKIIRNSVKANRAYAILGNHEDRLLKNLSEPSSPRGSIASLKTFLDFKKENISFKREVKFLKKLPVFIEFDKFVFCHAGLQIFNPNAPKNEFVYGFRATDTDSIYEEATKKGLNEKILIHGHVEATNLDTNFSFSLERGSCVGGEIVALPMDKFIADGADREAFEKNIVSVKTELNYKSRNVSVLTPLNRLTKEKLVSYKEDPSGYLKIWKYSKSVFFKNLWNEGGNVLLKARGLVTDLAGEIVVHPFDKVFNYKENGAGKELKDDDKVQYIQKLNGFLGNISFNPYTNKILYTTTGSFDSDFVDYIKYFVDKELEIKLLRFFSKNKVTLSFEVIHPEDPHIIDYPEEMQGLHLIGVRGLNPKDKNYPESEVDKVAQELGLRRPYVKVDTFGNVKKLLKELKDEGFMIRDLKTNEYICKTKSPYYLTTKFIGRMSKGNIKFMFNNPLAFKERIDEEFYTLVDKIVLKTNEQEFSSMDSVDRIEFVRKLIEEEE